MRKKRKLHQAEINQAAMRPQAPRPVLLIASPSNAADKRHTIIHIQPGELNLLLASKEAILSRKPGFLPNTPQMALAWARFNRLKLMHVHAEITRLERDICAWKKLEDTLIVEERIGVIHAEAEILKAIKTDAAKKPSVKDKFPTLAELRAICRDKSTSPELRNKIRAILAQIEGSVC